MVLIGVDIWAKVILEVVEGLRCGRGHSLQELVKYHRKKSVGLEVNGEVQEDKH